MTKVFIDGSAGTTGLRINERLLSRKDIKLISLPESLRKDTEARKEALNSADIVFLCLPDEAAVEAMTLISSPHTAVIDTSTAHRTEPEWSYGFPELWGKRDVIKNSRRIANPGCHASGFIALTEPLIRVGIIKKDTPLTCFSLTGYSGGGKKMIAEYESKERPLSYSAPRQYALSQQHKHLKEMTRISGLKTSPVFCPIVADFYSGMEVTVPLFAELINGSPKDIKEIYQSTYTGKIVRYSEKADDRGFISAAMLSGRDDMLITVSGNDERILLTAIFDNLGKGASGAAIQNMNILLGVQETCGLNIPNN